MSKIYELGKIIGFQGFTVKDSNLEPVYSLIKGHSLKETWQILNVEFVDKHLQEGDLLSFYFGGSLPVFSKKCVDILGNELEKFGEFLSLSCKGKTYYVFNLMNYIFALDKNNSEVRYWEDGTVKSIVKFTFEESKVKNQFIFRLKETTHMDIYVTDKLVNIVKNHKLKGFEFKLIWSSDNTGKIGEIIRP